VRTAKHTSAWLTILSYRLVPSWQALYAMDNLQVLLEVRRLAEHIWTVCTLMRFSARVNDAVSRQATGPREPFLTHGTFIRFGSSVDARVAIQFARSTECASTLIAFVRLFARVTPAVYDKFTGRREPFLADRALERLLSAVELHVHAQVLRTTERLAARRTLERFFPAVDSPVANQLTESCEPFAADSTIERPLPGVRSAMNRQRAFALEVLFAFCTQVLRLLDGEMILADRIGRSRSFGVLHVVPQQPLFGHKPFIAYGALERPFPGVSSRVDVQVSFV